MKVLLTGASGLLGRSLFPALESHSGFEAAGTALHRAVPPLVKLDITDPKALLEFLNAFKPDLIVHAAAERRPDVVDTMPDKATILNVESTRTIAGFARARGAFLLYISTDYVFDGTNPPYRADSPTHPLNEYGRLKLEGETALREAYSNGAADLRPAAILRIPILYGPVKNLDESPVTEIAKKIGSGSPCTIEHWASRYPVHVDDVTQAILLILEAYIARHPPFPSQEVQILQLSGKQSLTKYQMALAMAEDIGVDPRRISPDPHAPKGAPRPKDCRMDTSALDALGYSQHSDFSSRIGSILAPFFPPASTDAQKPVRPSRV